MNNYVYTIGNKIYINLTNRCSNNCDFCIRKGRDGMQNQRLWIDTEPDVQDILDQLPDNLDDYDDEIVFCGFGEPTYNLDTLDEVASYLHCIDKKTRINTNGQANLINKRDVTPELGGIIDAVSISLNAENAQKYQQVCASEFGEAAYDGLLEFARLAKEYVPEVVFSVVDVMSKEEIEACRKIAADCGVSFRVRE